MLLRLIRPLAKSFFMSKIFKYLKLCQILTIPETRKLREAQFPPDADETAELIQHFKAHGISPAIVGSVGVAHYVPADLSYRPTGDLDLFVSKIIKPLDGWVRDRNSPGIDSWVSPKGGLVDFLTPGHRFPDGCKVPSKVTINPKSDQSYPVALPQDILRIKLGSSRDKDIMDCVMLCRSMGCVPTEDELGKLTELERENLQMVRTWYTLRPTGNWGE